MNNLGLQINTENMDIDDEKSPNAVNNYIYNNNFTLKDDRYKYKSIEELKPNDCCFYDFKNKNHTYLGIVINSVNNNDSTYTITFQNYKGTIRYITKPIGYTFLIITGVEPNPYAKGGLRRKTHIKRKIKKHKHNTLKKMKKRKTKKMRK